MNAASSTSSKYIIYSESSKPISYKVVDKNKKQLFEMTNHLMSYALSFTLYIGFRDQLIDVKRFVLLL